MSAVTMRRPSPWSRTDTLVRQLAEQGWGELAGGRRQGLRTVLHALASILRRRHTGEDKITTAQLASYAGLGVRWTQDRLTLLEAMGLVRWVRGGVDATGHAVPSSVTLIKTRLIDLIDAARPIKDAADAARHAATNTRIAALLRAGVRPRPPQTRRSEHAHAVHTSPPQGVKSLARPPGAAGAQADPGACPHEDPRGPRYCALCRHGIAA